MGYVGEYTIQTIPEDVKRCLIKIPSSYKMPAMVAERKQVQAIPTRRVDISPNMHQLGLEYVLEVRKPASISPGDQHEMIISMDDLNTLSEADMYASFYYQRSQPDKVQVKLGRNFLACPPEKQKAVLTILSSRLYSHSAKQVVLEVVAREQDAKLKEIFEREFNGKPVREFSEKMLQQYQGKK